MSASPAGLRQWHHIKDSCKITVARAKALRRTQNRKAHTWISMPKNRNVFRLYNLYLITLDCIPFFLGARPTSVFSLIKIYKNNFPLSLLL